MKRFLMNMLAKWITGQRRRPALRRDRRVRLGLECLEKREVLNATVSVVDAHGVVTTFARWDWAAANGGGTGAIYEKQGNQNWHLLDLYTDTHIAMTAGTDASGAAMVLYGKYYDPGSPAGIGDLLTEGGGAHGGITNLGWFITPGTPIAAGRNGAFTVIGRGGLFLGDVASPSGQVNGTIHVDNSYSTDLLSPHDPGAQRLLRKQVVDASLGTDSDGKTLVVYARFSDGTVVPWEKSVGWFAHGLPGTTIATVVQAGQDGVFFQKNGSALFMSSLATTYGDHPANPILVGLKITSFRVGTGVGGAPEVVARFADGSVQELTAGGGWTDLQGGFGTPANGVVDSFVGPETSQGLATPQDEVWRHDDSLGLRFKIGVWGEHGLTEPDVSMAGLTTGSSPSAPASTPLPPGMSLTPHNGAFDLTVTGDQGGVRGDQVLISDGSLLGLSGLRISLNGASAVFRPGLLRTINLNLGGGQNTEQILSLPADVTVNVNLAGNDKVTVGSDGTPLANVAGTVNLVTPPASNNHSAGKATLAVDDAADAADQQADITRDSVTVGQTVVHYDGGVTALTVLGGSGHDAFRISSTAAATPVTVSAGAGTSDVLVGALEVSWSPYITRARHSLAAIAGAVAVQRRVASGHTTLTVDDSGEAARNLTVTGNTVSFAKVAPVTYSGLSALVLVEGTGNAAVNFQGRAPGIPVTLYNAQSKTVAVAAGWQVKQVAGPPSWDGDHSSGIGAASAAWTPPSSGPAEAPWLWQEAYTPTAVQQGSGTVAQQSFVVSAAAQQASLASQAARVATLR